MDSIKELELLGERLRVLRIKAEQTQDDFAARIGVSIPTLRRMEKGDPNTAIRYWMEAIGLLGHEKEIQSLLCEQRSLFDEDKRAASALRKRVRRPAAGKPSVP
jgi:transcriptional regulator with XRE-family HTH domain